MHDWQQFDLGDIASINIGGTPSRVVPEYWAENFNDGFPWVSIADLKERIQSKTSERITKLGVQHSNVKLVKKGSVLMSFKLSLGRVAFAGNDLYTNEAIAAFEVANDKVIDEYLYYALPEAVAITVTDTAVKGATLNKEKLKNISLCLPPVKQQQKIAHILTTVDNLIEKTQALIDKYTAVKQGMMHDLFTRGIDLATGQLRPSYEQAPELYKETELGWVPREWGVCAICEVAAVKGGKRLPAGTPFAEGITPFPYLRVTDMVNGGIDDSVLVYVDEQTEKYISRYKIFKDDIYVTIAGTLGMFGRIPNYLDGAQLTENAARITDIDPSKFNIDYLCGFLRSDYLLPQFNAAVGIGAGVPKLALYHIEGFKSPCPSLREQELVVASIKSVDALQAEQLAALGKLQSQKKGLMQDLLTGRVRLA